VVDRENCGIVGVLADADSIPTSTPLTASASPLCYRLVPAPISLSFAFVLNRTTQLPRRPPFSLSTPQRNIYDAHSLIKGPRLNLTATLGASRRLAGPPLLDSSLRVFGFTSGIVFLFSDLPLEFLLLTNRDSAPPFIPLILASRPFRPYP
jgi:hypothetical protein